MNNPFEDRLNDAVEAEQQELTCRNYDDAAELKKSEQMFEEWLDETIAAHDRAEERRAAAALDRKQLRSTPSKRRLLRTYTRLQLWDVLLHDPASRNWEDAYSIAFRRGTKNQRPQSRPRNARQRREEKRRWDDIPF